MPRFLSVAVVFAAGLVLAPVAVRGGEDEDVLRFLARLGLVDLQILQLEKAVQKDLPTEPIEGLQLAAVPPRESAGDALVAPGVDSVWDLPAAACVGTYPDRGL